MHSTSYRAPSADRWLQRSRAFLLLLVACGASARTADPAKRGQGEVADLRGRLVAVGIPGASALSQVGTFHPGGPIRDKPTNGPFTRPGAVLDSERILVASSSNFGAALGRADQPAGGILSIDPRGTGLVEIPADFAASGGQAQAVGGRVILLTANSADFLNRLYNPEAVTADFPPVAAPTGISINNAFGRLWFTSSPGGAGGAGLHSILDPDGRPLAGAPNKLAGGVFLGALTNRTPQLAPGSMTAGAIATALLGKSPDASGRAVFASLHADGSVVQLHAEQGVDGLAPAGTISPLAGHPGITRAGMTFNWVPNPILFVTDPCANSILALSLRSDTSAFVLEGSRRLRPVELDVPIDMAPAVAEIASSLFSSNTTLAGDADLYVANRGSGTVVRLRQSGEVVAVRRIVLPGLGPLGAGRLNGIAVSADAQRIWVTVNGKLPGQPEGAVVELPAFGAGVNSSPR